jgi:glycerophosphoryl diester phosphodiesterase
MQVLLDRQGYDRGELLLAFLKRSEEIGYRFQAREDEMNETRDRKFSNRLTSIARLGRDRVGRGRCLILSTSTKSGHKNASKCNDYKLAIIVASIIFTIHFPAQAQSSRCEEDNPYKVESWDGKLLYGSYSTLVSSHIIGREFPRFILNIQNPRVSMDQLKRESSAISARYRCLNQRDVEYIISYAAQNRSPTIYEEERSSLRLLESKDFADSMVPNSNFMPPSYLIKDGIFSNRNSFQLAAHRGLYNNAYLIPQNSLAAMYNAYLAGIREIEVDVLETSSSDSYQNVIIHDLTTNRLDGTFHLPPNAVSESTYIGNIDHTHIGIMNPLSDSEEIQSSGIHNVVTLDRLFDVAQQLMPEATFYLDSRNESPVSYIGILKNKPSSRDQFISKIYPFKLPNGAVKLRVQERTNNS